MATQALLRSLCCKFFGWVIFLDALSFWTVASVVLTVYWLAIAWRLRLGHDALESLVPWTDAMRVPLDGKKISVVIAARNEAARLAGSIEHLLKQREIDFELVIVDDRSTDATGQIAQEASQRDSRVQYVRVDDLPSGWLGKCHACWQGVQRASGDWILFTDGDIHLSDDVIARAVAVAEQESAHHLTLFPDLLAESLGVRAAILGQSQFFTLYTSPETINADKSNRWVGIGAFNLIRRDAYDGIGGHEALRMEVVDDMKLGYLINRNGFRQRVYGGMSDVQADWAQTIPGVIRALEKNWYAATEFNLAGSLLFFVLVPATVLGSLVAPFFSWFGLLPMLSLVIVGAQSLEVCRQFKWPWYAAFLAPLGWLVFVAAGIWSVHITLKQDGIRWRDSFYPLDELKRGVVR